MEEAALEGFCRDIVAVGSEVAGGRPVPMSAAHLSRAATSVMPAVERQIGAVFARNAKLFREARIEPEDLAQEVMRRLLEAPPVNPEGRNPVAAVLGWARAVAHNILIDRRRRFLREVTTTESTDDEDGERRGLPELTDPERAAEDVLAVLREIDRMRAASEELGTYKYIRETFLVLVEDPDVPAPDLARRVGLIEPPPRPPIHAEYTERAKKAAQYAWKLRQRTLDVLAERLGHGRRQKSEKRA